MFSKFVIVQYYTFTAENEKKSGGPHQGKKVRTAYIIWEKMTFFEALSADFFNRQTMPFAIQIAICELIFQLI